jgi:hypothetical protein
MKFWFGSARKKTAPRASPPAPSPGSNDRAKTALQREVVDVALQGTLIRHGIPRSWVVAELQTAPPIASQARADICLIVRQWGGLPWIRAAAFQRTFVRRISLLDRNQHLWLRCVAWQFKLHEEGESGGSSQPSAAVTVPAPLTELFASQDAPTPAKADPPAPRQESAKERQSRLAAASAKLRSGWRDNNVAEFEDTMPFERAH